MASNMMNGMCSGIDNRSCHPFRVEIMGGFATGGYASLTPGYYHITPTGSQNESLRDFVTAVVQAGLHFENTQRVDFT